MDRRPESAVPRTECNCRRYEGKVAVVTGSTAGIGLAIAERLGLEGAKVVVSSRKQDSVDASVERLRGQGIQCTGTTCHVADAKQRQHLIDTAVQTYGRIDVLVNNAVVNPTMGPLSETPVKAISKILEVNIQAGLLLTQAALPHMASGSAILFISSITAYHPGPPLSMYAVSKTALLGLVKALGTELGARGIRVNGLAPGFVPTKLSQALVESPETRAHQEAQTALGRLGRADEIAAAAAFMCSDDASYVTCETLVAAGGMPSKL